MKVFRKEQWLISATEEMNQGILTEEEIRDAEKTWVDRFDGKEREELFAAGNDFLRDEWFEEVSETGDMKGEVIKR